MQPMIKVSGARTHNLKNVKLDIPKNKVVVFTGVSGSGKSSLVFDTIYAEAQRQLLETFSSYARARMSQIGKPDVDEIENLSPVIVIDQKRMHGNARSTVGTSTEIYSYLRLLFSRCGKPLIGDSSLFSFNRPEGMCMSCKGLGVRQEVDPHKVLNFDKSMRQGASRINIFKPSARYYNIIEVSGRLDMDKPIKNYTKEELDFLLYSPHVVLSSKAQGFVQSFSHEGIVRRIQIRVNDPRNPWGSADLAKKYVDLQPCDACGGSRLNKKSRSVKVNGKSIAELVDMELTDLDKFLAKVKGPVEDPVVKRISESLKHLIAIGVGYLSLNRSVGTLSGGESQRVKMARQLGCNLVDLIYVLDEPSIGLHPKDLNHLLNILKELKKNGNSVLVVEHDPSVIEAADYVVDIGPGAGSRGGKITFTGTFGQLKKSKTVTGEFLRSKKKSKPTRRKSTNFLKIKNARVHNLKNISVDIPTGVFTCVTGVAGSGKSSLINDVLAKEHPKSIVVDQSGVGKSSRSNPATYTKVFGDIRNEFAKGTGKKAGLFSFNSDGACQKCKGHGTLKIEMHMLDDVMITCDECNGERYTQKVLDLKYKGKNISDVLKMTVREAVGFFEGKEIKRKLAVLEAVGLDYLELGQPLNSLSGGEAQRIKLASELHKKGNIYIMDEPTTGLHMADIDKLLKIIEDLVNSGNTVIVIEHNLDVIRSADWLIDLGPEGGSKGGKIVAVGTPEAVSKIKTSYTGAYLKKVI
ncbi:excinuclease ABC subunit UvrA [Candidatus Woesearchaeota archaeon]|jgi:excinuclease UvrABC ATPase subunit|nr:excinuclease ABC subunit UvrA [Candidatus Woesearchaeota archaeon]MBT4248615.1 excinuclease ABC subunit UvrA [Candidatus Woesearchaeota archaeon]